MVPSSVTGRRSAARGTRSIALVAAAAVVCAIACTVSQARSASAADGIHKIKHVIMIMQENRSFDSYFGTFPGADGIPMSNGTPTVCVPDPAAGTCVKPYPDHSDHISEGAHGYVD